MIGGRLVREGAVDGQIERGLEIAGDDVELDVAGVELVRYLEKSRGDAILLPFEQLDRNRPLVVRLHELLAFPLQLFALAPEIGKLGFRVDSRCLQFLNEQSLDFESEIPVERDLCVVFLDAGFHLVDENSFLAAVVALAVPTRAHEVGVVDARAGLGYLHEQPGPAGPAVDGALQEMRMVSGTLSVHVGDERVLDGLPRLLIDERLVFAGMQGTFERHATLVVRVEEQLVQFGRGDGHGRDARSAQGG